MRILIISNAYPSKEKKYSGIFVKNQYEKLKEIAIANNDCVHLYAMKRKQTSGIKSILKYLLFIIGFYSFLFKKFDVVHIHFLSPLILLPFLYKQLYPGTKVVMTFHGSDINLLQDGIQKKIYTYFSKFIDYTIPVGSEVAKNMVEKLGIPIGEIMPVGVDDNIFYFTNQNKKYDFLFVGSFLFVKGIDILYNAIKKSSKTLSFCIVGKGDEYENKFNKLAIEGYNITLLIDQTQEELRDIYNVSSFLLLPSRSEGFPTVTIESMFCGTPVITSDISQFKEQVEEGVNGFTVPVESVERLIEKLIVIKNLNKMEYDELQKGALSSFNELSLRFICEKLYNIYSKLTIA